MKRPLGVTLLAIILVLAAGGNCLRLSEAVFFWKILGEYSAYPLYIAFSGGFWLLATLFLARGIWQGKTWAWVGTIGGTTCYGSWYWFDRLALQSPHANWQFALVLTVLLAGSFALILLSPKTRAYFIKYGNKL